MTFWILAGLLTAIVAGFTLTPLARQRQGLALILLGVIAAAVLGLYFWLGYPA